MYYIYKKNADYKLWGHFAFVLIVLLLGNTYQLLPDMPTITKRPLMCFGKKRPFYHSIGNDYKKCAQRAKKNVP
jgi:hypothetical protein